MDVDPVVPVIGDHGPQGEAYISLRARTGMHIIQIVTVPGFMLNEQSIIRVGKD